MAEKFSVDLGLAFIPETANPALFNELYKVYNAIKILAGTLDIYTGAIRPDEDTWPQLTAANTILSQNVNRIYVPFSEDVTPGQVVTLFNDSGVVTAKLAGGPVWAGDCRGFMSLLTTVTSGTFGEVTLFGLHSLLTGATPAAIYYTSPDTPGLFTDIEPSSPGQHLQRIGYALNTGGLFFNPELVSTIVP